MVTLQGMAEDRFKNVYNLQHFTVLNQTEPVLSSHPQTFFIIKRQIEYGQIYGQAYNSLV